MCSSLFSPGGFAVKHNKYLKLAVTAGLVIIFDQITKAVIQNTVLLYHSIEVIPGFFSRRSGRGGYCIWRNNCTGWRAQYIRHGCIPILW